VLELRTLTILTAFGAIIAILIAGVVLASIDPVGAADGSRECDPEENAVGEDCQCSPQDGTPTIPAQDDPPVSSEGSDPEAMPDPEHSLTKPLPVGGVPPL